MTDSRERKHLSWTICKGSPGMPVQSENENRPWNTVSTLRNVAIQISNGAHLLGHKEEEYETGLHVGDEDKDKD